MSTDAYLPQNLSEWVSAQRWYADKGSVPRFERLGGWHIERDGVVITTHYLLDHGTGRATLYQIPLTERTQPLDGIHPIETIAAGTTGERFVYDATADPVYAVALLELMLSDTAAVTGDSSIEGHRQPGATNVEVTASHVLRGEQSNTSIICEVSEGTPVIIKVFRALHHGENPDVTLQSAIAAAGSDLVPRSIGAVTGSWSDTGRTDGYATGHLAFAQEFLPGVQDAWRVALRAAEANEDFTDRAHRLGVATAEVHAVLASELPTRVATTEDIDATLLSMRSRLAAAEGDVPAIADLHGAIDTIFDAARRASWPPLQRIHGDYHLGQVLWVENRGWVLLDFEGEPLRPMAERSELDIALRDVAGMLRSFDYVAGSVAQGAAALVAAQTGEMDATSAAPSHDAAVRWAANARRAFMNGYIERSGLDLHAHHELLDAFEIDKALYEAVYESRNRPDWIDIPVSAIHRLATQHPGGSRLHARYV